MKIHFQKFKFTFKFNNKKIFPNLIDSHIDVAKVDDKIQKILRNYKTHKNVFKLDGNFFLENIKFYKLNEKNDMITILEILVFLCNQNVIKKEILETRSRSYKLDEIAEPDKLGPNIPKSPFPMYNSFRTVLEKEMNSGNIQLEDFSNIFLSLKMMRNCSQNFYFILSDYLKIFLNRILTGSTPEKKLLIEENKSIKHLKILIQLPYAKITIGNFMNQILLKHFNSISMENDLGKNKKIKIPDDLVSFINSFYYNYDNQVYLNFILPNRIKSGSSNNSILEENSFNTTLSFLQRMISPRKSSENNVNNISLSKSNYEELDEHLSNTIKIINENNSEIDTAHKLQKIEKIVNIFTNSEKSNVKEILLLPKFINRLNLVLLEYNEVNSKKEIFYEYFRPIQKFMNFYFKYYAEYKQYLYTSRKEHKFLHSTFDDYNTVSKNFFDVLKIHNINKIKKFEYEEMTSLLNPLQNAFFSNIKSDTYDNFCFEFLLSKENILEKVNFDATQKHRLLHKIILCIFNLSSVDNNNVTWKLDNYIEQYIDCYNSDIDEDQINFYFINLCTITYNYLLNYKENSIYQLNDNLINRMCNLLLKLMKYFSISDIKFLRRIVLIVENLKVFQSKYNLMDKQLRKKFTEIEKMFRELSQATRNSNSSSENLMRKDIWWAKDCFYMNKYNASDIQNNLLMKGVRAEMFPDLNNCYYSDFLIKNEQKELYVEFVGSYHLNHYLDNPHNFSHINNKYAKKKEIYGLHDKSLVYIPFEKILDDDDENLYNLIVNKSNSL